MCPACMSSVALMVGALLSTGGFTTLVVKTFHSKRNAQIWSEVFSRKPIACMVLAGQRKEHKVSTPTRSERSRLAVSVVV